MQLDPAIWHQLYEGGPPTTVTGLANDRGMSADLFACEWSSHSAVLKVSRQRTRGDRERQALEHLVSSDTPRLQGFVERDADVLLLLEDLRGCTPGDILQGVTASQTLEVMHLLGRTHARWSGRAHAGWSDAPPRWRDTTASDIATFLDRNPHPWGTTHLHALLDTREAQNAVLSAQPRTLAHADAHLDNWMFRPGGAPILIDWETARIAPGILDVARFLLEGVHTDVRRTLGDAPLQTWCAHVGLPMEDARAALRAAVEWSITAMVPHHASVELAALPVRMQQVHRHCAQQVMDLAEDLL